MCFYIRLTGEFLLLLVAAIAVLSVPLTFCNFATYLGAFYIFVADIMYQYGLNNSQEAE